MRPEPKFKVGDLVYFYEIHRFGKAFSGDTAVILKVEKEPYAGTMIEYCVLLSRTDSDKPVYYWAIEPQLELVR